MKTSLFTFFLLLSLQKAFCCCSAGMRRIIPIGESDGSIIVVEFKLSRYCKIEENKKATENGFWYKGYCNLAKYNGNSISVITKIDSFDLQDCNCDHRELLYKTSIHTKLIPYYKKALQASIKLNGFKKITPVTYKNKFIAEKEGTYKVLVSDTSANVYRQNKKLELTPVNWGASGFLSTIVEIRKYKTSFNEFEIITLSNPLSTFDSSNFDDSMNEECFFDINNAITRVYVGWHGTLYDYLILI